MIIINAVGCDKLVVGRFEFAHRRSVGEWLLWRCAADRLQPRSINVTMSSTGKPLPNDNDREDLDDLEKLVNDAEDSVEYQKLEDNPSDFSTMSVTPVVHHTVLQRTVQESFAIGGLVGYDPTLWRSIGPQIRFLGDMDASSRANARNEPKVSSTDKPLPTDHDREHLERVKRGAARRAHQHAVRLQRRHDLSDEITEKFEKMVIEKNDMEKSVEYQQLKDNPGYFSRSTLPVERFHRDAYQRSDVPRQAKSESKLDVVLYRQPTNTTQSRDE
jgi:hypothetical protein